MNKPTDGPWEIKHSQTKDAWNIVGTRLGGLYKIARLPYHQDKRMSDSWNKAQAEEQKANARLIIASHDLLEACEAALANMQHFADTSQRDWEVRGLLNEAIKKAKGYE